jgi:hypothetical protein
VTMYNFGIGALIAKRTDVTGQPPAFFGTITDVNVDFDRKIEFLIGQYNMPVAAGGGELKIAGKAKNARFQSTTLTNTFLGTNVGSTTAGSMLEMAISEAQTIPAASPFTRTVTNSAGWIEDLGVFYASGLNSNQLSPVGALTAAGQYTAAAGIYTFFSLDAGAAVNIYYTYTVAVSGSNKLAITNALMGPVPTFELNLKESFNYFGVNKNIIVQLNACVSSKLTWPFANAKFSVQDFEFQAIADASNNIGTISMTE